MVAQFIQRHKQILLYGICLALLLALLRWLELMFTIFSYAVEIYIGAIAVLFTLLGIWVANKLTTPKVKTVVVEKEVFIKELEPFIQDEEQVQQIGLSKREMEVLQLMATGMSNNEIAEQLFVSVATIKTHTNRIFDKMDVQRRTQAIEKAKRLRMIA